MALVKNTFIDFLNLVGGINTVSSSIGLSKDEFRDAQDVDLFPLRGWSKRNGYTVLNVNPVGSNPCTGLYQARYSTSGGTNVEYLVSGSKLYSMNSSLGGTWTDITGGLGITNNQDKIWNFEILNDIAIAGNGTDTPIQINSSGVASTLLSGLPFTTFKFPLVSRGYALYFVPTVSGNVEYDRLYFSDINDPTTVDVNNYIDIGKKQGGDVRGAVEYKTFVYVFKRHGIHQIIFQPTQVDSTGTLFPWIEYPSPVVPGVGCQSHRSIVKFTTPSTHATPGQELVFFVDQLGVPRIFDGTTTISFSSKIGFSRNSNIMSLDDMDNTRAPFCFSINYPSKSKILCFMSSENSQQNVCWVMDYSTGFSILRYNFSSSFNVGCLFEKSDGSFKPFVGDYSGKVFELDSGTTDNGAGINDYIRTGDVFIKSPIFRSKWFTLDVRGFNGSSTQKTKVSYYLDGQDTPTATDSRSLSRPTTLWGLSTPMIWGQSQWSSSGPVSGTFEINQVAKTLGLKLESYDKVNDSLVAEGFFLEGEALGTVRE